MGSIISRLWLEGKACWHAHSHSLALLVRKEISTNTANLAKICLLLHLKSSDLSAATQSVKPAQPPLTQYCALRGRRRPSSLGRN